MKKKILFLTVFCTFMLLLLPACDAREAGSLKSITRPYIAHYECTHATLGEENILEKFDYIELVLVDRQKMEFIFKPKDGERHVIECDYTFDVNTRELTAEIGIYGYRFRESTIVEHGKFTIAKALGSKQLIMKFKAK